MQPAWHCIRPDDRVHSSDIRRPGATLVVTAIYHVFSGATQTFFTIQAPVTIQPTVSAWKRQSEIDSQSGDASEAGIVETLPVSNGIKTKSDNMRGCIAGETAVRHLMGLARQDDVVTGPIGVTA